MVANLLGLWISILGAILLILLFFLVKDLMTIFSTKIALSIIPMRIDANNEAINA